MSLRSRDAVDPLLRFGAMMLRAGNTAIRTSEWIKVLSRKMGFDAISVSLSLDSITLGVRRAGESITAMREIGPPGINASRIVELEQLAKASELEAIPRTMAMKLDEIEAMPPRYSSTLIAAAVGMASGGFAFLSGAAAAEMTAAAIAGGIGQSVRSWMAHRQFNQYGAATSSAIVASGIYVLAAALGRYGGLEFAHYPAGFIASVLFLIPGFPLVAALFDLLQLQTVAAVSRLAYGIMLLLAVALGLSLVVALAGIDLSRQPQLEIAYPLKLGLRAVASFVAACAFAMLFNSSARISVAVGLLALAANSIRLLLTDIGTMLAPAAFIAALVIGSAAMLADKRFSLPPMAITVAPIVIMMPGIYAYEMIVLFNHGQMLDALQATASCGFVVGALALGLATARIFSWK